MENRVSVIVTVRNEQRNVRILLDALLAQTFIFYEIVINDNGSADQTVNVIKEYQRMDGRIKLVESGGQSIGEGRNAAIRASTGDILAIMDAGIRPEATWLENVVRPLLNDSGLDVSWGHVVFDTKSRVLPSTDVSKALVFLTKYPENRLSSKNVTTSAFRRRVWEDMRGFPEIRIPIEDLILIDMIDNGGFKTVWAGDAKAYYFSLPKRYSDVFKKWILSAYCAFIARKSERGFYRQLIKFSLFFVSLFLMLIDPRLIVCAVAYVVVYFFIRYRTNPILGREVFYSPGLFFKTIFLFFLLNTARLTGATKAVIDILAGKSPKIVYGHIR